MKTYGTVTEMELLCEEMSKDGAIGNAASGIIRVVLIAYKANYTDLILSLLDVAARINNISLQRIDQELTRFFTLQDNGDGLK